jgi:hypothetical protein
LDVLAADIAGERTLAGGALEARIGWSQPNATGLGPTAGSRYGKPVEFKWAVMDRRHA